jgi:protein TonB
MMRTLALLFLAGCAGAAAPANPPDFPQPAPPTAADPSQRGGADAVDASTAGLEKPVVVSRTPLVLTKDAVKYHIQGVALVKCVVELDGSLSACRIVKGLPFLDEAILSSISNWKCEPATYQGHPQRVEMTFAIRVGAPQAAPAAGSAASQ